MDKFSAMQAFVRVVEAGTFTKAADSMSMPKPTVTRLIQTLEKQLDTKLLHRTTRKVMVTADGAAYYERAGRLLSEIEELEASMSRAKATPRGRLKVDIPAALGIGVVIPALPDFFARYPEIQLDLGVSDRPVDLISDNVDCVIRGGLITDESMVARHIGEVHLISCASPIYLKRYGAPTHPSDLEKTHKMVIFISPKTGRLHTTTFSKDGKSIEINAQYNIAINDSNAYVAAGLAGLGVMHALTFLVHEHISSGALEPLMTDWSTEPVPIHAVYPPNRHLSNKVRVFVDWIAEVFSRNDLIQRKSTLPGQR